MRADCASISCQRLPPGIRTTPVYDCLLNTMTTDTVSPRKPPITDLLRERILVLYGAMSSMIQRYGLVEAD